jgi:6-phosphogluconolactonase (cycloisomerase 2 family)
MPIVALADFVVGRKYLISGWTLSSALAIFFILKILDHAGDNPLRTNCWLPLVSGLFKMFIARPLPFEKNLQLLSVFIRKKRLMGFLWMALSAVWILLPDQSWSALQFVEARYGGPVLDGACGLAASPDGNHLYAAGYYDGVIAVYNRDSGTGRLTLIQVQRDGVDGVDGLDCVLDVAVSPDGRHLYAVGDWDDGLAVFSRDSTTGALTFVEVQKEGAGGVVGLDGAVAVEVSPDNRHVYVASSLEDSVAVFSRDSTTGALTFVGVYTDSIGGVEGISGASAIDFSPDGLHIYITGYFGNSLALFTRDSATGALTFIEAHYDGVGGVDGLDGAYGVTLSPAGEHLYVASIFDDAVAVFARDATTGRLTFTEAVFDGAGGVDGLAGATEIAVSPDGGHCYVSGWFDDSLVTFSRDSATGTLSFVQVQFDDTAGADGLYGAWSVLVSADGAYVYASGEYDNALGVFSRDSASGQLTFIEAQRNQYDGADGLFGVVDVTVSPDGNHLYAAGYDEDSVAVFARDNITGQLTFIEVLEDGVNGVDGLSRAHALTVSPDGAHLYAVGYGEDAVVVFDRDAATGRLTFVQVHKDGAGGVDGLDGARAVAVSPDGAHVYVAGYMEDAVAVFSRNSTTGELSFVEVQRDNANGVDGLDGVRGLALASDGGYLYASGRSDSAVAVFSRNAATGQLTFVEMQKDGVGGVDGLYGARAVAVSADGGSLYAMGHYDNAVAVFARAATGQLTFEQMRQDGSGGVDGLSAVSALAMSPDGYHLYAAGSYDSAIAVFSVDSDNDGVSDAVEDGGSGAGDANGDGIPDSQQGNVATLKTYDNAYYVTLVAPDGTILSNCSAMANPSPSDSPQDVDFTYGFFQFTIDGIPAGGGAALVMHLPAGAVPLAYYKYGPTPDNPAYHWYAFPEENGTGARIVQNTVTLYFVDGQRGDDVLTADSMIVDIGAPAFEKTAAGASSGSSGGGCFITSSVPASLGNR